VAITLVELGLPLEGVHTRSTSRRAMNLLQQKVRNQGLRSFTGPAQVASGRPSQRFMTSSSPAILPLQKPEDIVLMRPRRVRERAVSLG
jgi:hypothetical protein